MMANGYDAGSMYDVGAPQATAGLIDSGDAGMQVLQRELLRRQQFAQQQMEMQRQAALDAQAVELHKATLANTRENTASLVSQRKAIEENERQKTLKLQSDAWDAAHGAGENITDPNVLKQGFALGKIRVQSGTPAQAAMPEVPGVLAHDEMPDVPAVPAKAAVEAAPDQNINIGTPAQLQHEQAQKFLELLATGKSGIDRTDPIAVEAAWNKATGGKTALPAGVVVPKQTPAEKETEFNARMIDIGAKKRMGEPITKKEDAEYTEWATRKPTTAERTGIAVNLIDKRGAVAAENQATNRLDRAITKTQDDWDKTYVTPANQKFERAAGIRESLRVGGVGAAEALPAFLTVMSGGQYSNLRMSEVELGRIEHARPELFNFAVKVNKWIDTDGKSKILFSPGQEAQINELMAYVERRERAKVAVAHDFKNRLNDVLDSTDMRTVKNDFTLAIGDPLAYLQKRAEALIK